MKDLQPEVRAKYILIGIRPGKYNFKGFGEIDLCALSVARVDSLVERGFTHFKLRNGGSAAPPADQVKQNLKARPIGSSAGPAKNAGGEIPVEDLRKNKQFVNKLLTMDWKDMSHQDHLVFFNDQVCFQTKKAAFLIISGLDSDMKSLHAKAKAIKKGPANDAARKEVMQEIAAKEESKVHAWAIIDTWEEPSSDQEDIAKKAAAIEKDKLIKAHKIFILRAENVLPNMPEKTAAEKKRKEHKAAEVARRKEELIKMGSPYNEKAK
jgi:hypothetical protein